MSRVNILDTVSKDAGIYAALIATSDLLILIIYFSTRAVGFSVQVSEFDCLIWISLAKDTVHCYTVSGPDWSKLPFANYLPLFRVGGGNMV